MGTIAVGQENSTPIELYYEDHGSGPVVVLIHGWPLDGTSWEKQTRMLLANGYRVITYDRRGNGKSSKPVSGCDYDTFAADLDQLMTTLDLRDVTLIGFSMGTGECARYLGKYGRERVRKVVFIAGVTPFLKKTADNPTGVDAKVFEELYQACVEDRPAFFREFFQNFFNVDVLGPEGEKRISQPALDASFAAALQMGPTLAAEQIKTWPTDFREDARKISIPALVIHGDQDRATPLEAAGKPMSKLLEHGRLAVIKNAPHGLLWTHAEETNQLLLNFLKE